MDSMDLEDDEEFLSIFGPTAMICHRSRAWKPHGKQEAVSRGKPARSNPRLTGA
jgi:hypothetical protein